MYITKGNKSNTVLNKDFIKYLFYFLNLSGFRFNKHKYIKLLSDIKDF